MEKAEKHMKKVRLCEFYSNISIASSYKGEGIKKSRSVGYILYGYPLGCCNQVHFWNMDYVHASYMVTYI